MVYISSANTRNRTVCGCKLFSNFQYFFFIHFSFLSYTYCRYIIIQRKVTFVEVTIGDVDHLGTGFSGFFARKKATKPRPQMVHVPKWSPHPQLSPIVTSKCTKLLCEAVYLHSQLSRLMVDQFLLICTHSQVHPIYTHLKYDMEELLLSEHYPMFE